MRIELTDDDNEWQDESGWHIQPGLTSISIRGQVLPLAPTDGSAVRLPNGRLEGSVPVEDLFRRLVLSHRHLFLATEHDLRSLVPADLPQFLRLDEWEHSDAVREVLPSHTECFPMLAKALVTGDASHYKPTKPPNTHWSNWPEGGAL